VKNINLKKIDISSIFDGWNNIDPNDPSSWPNSFRIFGGIVIAAGIIYDTHHFLAKPKIQSLETAERKEGDLKKEFKEKKALAINLEAYKAQMIEAENMFSLLKEQLPSATEIPDLLTDVTQLGLSRGLTFNEFQPRNDASKGFYSEKPVKIIVQGQYHQLANFISDIAALPRIVNVGNFDIKSTGQRTEGAGAKLLMNANINTYYYQEEQ